MARMGKVESLLRQVRKIRSEIERAERRRPAAGMVVVRYAGLSGLLQQAREDGKLDERGKRIGPPLVSLADPRPASGVSAMLWDAMMTHRDRKNQRLNSRQQCASRMPHS